MKKLLELLPGILGGIIAVEGAIKGAPGETKKAVILSAISAATIAGEQIPERHVQAISVLIDGIVGTLNHGGVFQSAPAPPPPLRPL